MPPKTIVFFHPDLGIGGAERLILDAAVGLQSLGHRIVIYTSHRDTAHCFDEARDGTLDVRVRGNTIFPATIGGRFKILLTILRQFHLLFLILLSGELKGLGPDVFVLDQLSAGIPLLRHFFPGTRVLFYCHFPDLLLVQGQKGWLRQIWRAPFDWLEGWSMRGADRVVVNSLFTKGVVKGVWGEEFGGESGIGIVYPCVDTKDVDPKVKRPLLKARRAIAAIDEDRLWEGKKIILSINRFERKKDVGLAIRAFAKLPAEVRKNSKLVIAGGYDPRVQENLSYHEELVALAASLGLQAATPEDILDATEPPFENTEVLFFLSVPAQLKDIFLRRARLLVYTPSNEHFGIVPLEAMLAGVPVLAANSGGPLETVVENKTGWLRDVQDIDAWSAVMRNVLAELSDAEVVAMGKAGRERVRAEFSRDKMARTLDQELDETLARPRVQTLELQDLLLAAGVGGVVLMVVAALVYRLFVPIVNVPG